MDQTTQMGTVVSAEASGFAAQSSSPSTAVSLQSAYLPETRAKHSWKIDDVLRELMGRSVRVAAESFAPLESDVAHGRMIQTRDLILPDNTGIEAMPVFFEGVLLEAKRQIGVVHVRLGAPANAHGSAEGCVHFRGEIAVLLRGPAVVRMAVPWRIEPVPKSEGNYWLDLRLPRAQLVLDLGLE